MNPMESDLSPDRATLAPLTKGDELPLAAMAQLAAELEERPDNARGWYELGCAYNREGRYEAAAHTLECCFALSPMSLAVQSELAWALSGKGDLGEAGALFERVISQDPGNGWAYFQLGMVRYRMNILHEAVPLWECGVGLLDDPCDSLENLAMAYRRLGNAEKEKHCWQRLRDFSAGHPAVRHMLAAHGQAPLTPRADDAYLRYLFDSFAPDFDAVLQTLDYHVPDLVEARLREIHGPPSPKLRVLDAGCGTGLCGERLRPWSRHLAGVDISPGMLARARLRDIYDELTESELVEFLQHRTGEPYDWIVAGDVLCYFGDLEHIIAAAACRLVPAGRLFLTVEKDPGQEGAPPAGYRLQSHGRYCHTQACVEGAATAAGTILEQLAIEVLRHESGEPVAGICAVLLKV